MRKYSYIHFRAATFSACDDGVLIAKEMCSLLPACPGEGANNVRGGGYGNGDDDFLPFTIDNQLSSDYSSRRGAGGGGYYGSSNYAGEMCQRLFPWRETEIDRQ